jgi:hypothetical protein
MDFNKIIKRVTDLITKPVETMQFIKNEPATIKDLYLNYALILAAIPAVASLIGWTIMGASLRYGLTIAVSTYIMQLLSVAIVGVVIDVLAPNFGSQKDMVASFKVAIYSMTASWVVGVILIIPSLGIIAWLGALYGIYLLYLGLIHIKNSTGDKVIPYLIVTAVAAAVVIYLSSYIAWRIAFGSAYRMASLMTY